MSEDYKLIQELANNDVKVLKEKGMTYGDSWRKRGGVGAFMMLSRKWDRIENIALGAGYDIFVSGFENTGDILDDIADLRRYLLLVEAHICYLQKGDTEEEEGPQKWTLRQGADPNNPKAGDWVKEKVVAALPVCPECRKDIFTDTSLVVYRKGECPIHGEEEDCGPGPGYVNQDGPQNSLSWKGAYCVAPPAVGPFDVIQVRWKDGTHSSMLVHEFGKIAEWSEVEMYRVIRDGTDPEGLPLPEPVRQWGGGRYGTAPCGQPHGEKYGVEKCLACQGIHARGAQCPDMTPHAGAHTHTISGTTGCPAQPSYSHTNGVGTLAGIASAVSGINIALGGAAASINS